MISCRGEECWRNHERKGRKYACHVCMPTHPSHSPVIGRLDAMFQPLTPHRMISDQTAYDQRQLHPYLHSNHLWRGTVSQDVDVYTHLFMQLPALLLAVPGAVVGRLTPTAFLELDAFWLEDPASTACTDWLYHVLLQFLDLIADS